MPLRSIYRRHTILEHCHVCFTNAILELEAPMRQLTHRHLTPVECIHRSCANLSTSFKNAPGANPRCRLLPEGPEVRRGPNAESGHRAQLEALASLHRRSAKPCKIMVQSRCTFSWGFTGWEHARIATDVCQVTCLHLAA